MASLLTLQIQNKHCANILHITDTHLFADEDGALLGIKSNASFLSVINEIKRGNRKYDLIVATGDFVQDGSKKSYARFAEQIKQFNTPCVWLAGNHDNFSYMQEVFSNYQLAENKVVSLGDNWLIVLLNSQVVGQACGLLPQSELQFLEKTLLAHTDKNVMVFLHHHPINSGCHWLDEHILKNSNELEEIVKKFPSIKGLGWGHIHQQQDHVWHNCHAFSTPSTCFQFKPNCYEFQLSNDEAPGWREIKLNEDGTIESNVFRIADNLFLPDVSQKGY
ncbi:MULTISPECIES: 3',5'-cyclic-AMP phosphodiesterase [unclassified Gilliamella]|uniref:3',5'-cyclic-AMP phosphodiesterase n=1 Tax=unclassified Gilliamella TaxID=2685620 RepID=UPI002269F3DD|nr:MULTISPECIES: 3',5'-cyclic-AMP phosphodiesterase [unclassified Gilliamella]MCX8584452.1 3',5'-cyclic-AMP phosphodiesterase [Gilliamella sp. B3372]MCX8593591.1 3',5'-cyclic-AMP phosphodiesterase [Gilliamella sp. B3367]MCX8661761.1 3',5'-cyclic-AMP phosphodiesterase [Gilliamella sp. B2911]